MKDKAHFFLGLAAEADARNCRRMSFLIAASNFRVGTRFNCSRFCLSSMDSISQILNFEPESERSLPVSVMRKQIDECAEIVRVLTFNEPDGLTVAAHPGKTEIGIQQPNGSGLTLVTDEFTSYSVREFYRSARLNRHLSPEVVQ